MSVFFTKVFFGNNITGLIFRNDMSENMKDLTMTNKVQNLMIAPVEGIK